MKRYKQYKKKELHEKKKAKNIKQNIKIKENDAAVEGGADC